MAIQNRMAMHYRKNVWWYPHLHTIMIIYIYIILYNISLYIIIYIYILYYIMSYDIYIYTHTVRNEILISIRSMVAFPHLRSSSQPHVFPQIQCAHGRLRRFLHHRQLGMQHAAVLNDTFLEGAGGWGRWEKDGKKKTGWRWLELAIDLQVWWYAMKQSYENPWELWGWFMARHANVSKQGA